LARLNIHMTGINMNYHFIEFKNNFKGTVESHIAISHRHTSPQEPGADIVWILVSVQSFQLFLHLTAGGGDRGGFGMY